MFTLFSPLPGTSQKGKLLYPRCVLVRVLASYFSCTKRTRWIPLEVTPGRWHSGRLMHLKQSVNYWTPFLLSKKNFHSIPIKFTLYSLTFFLFISFFFFTHFWRFIVYRLALYVYEYLLHVGAQKAAQTFLSEVNNCSDVMDIYVFFFFFLFLLILDSLYCRSDGRKISHLESHRDFYTPGGGELMKFF